MKKNFEVALLMSLESDWHRSIAMGVADFAQTVNNWTFHVSKPSDKASLGVASSVTLDGVICRRNSREMDLHLATLGIPAINVSWLVGFDDLDIPQVVSDEFDCARVASQFFLQKQFENFSYIGYPPWQNYRPTIEQTLEQIFDDRRYIFSSFEMTNDPNQPFGIDVEKLKRWIVMLPKPNGLLVWSSAVGKIVTSVCGELDLIIPNEIAILCIEHDPLWSSLAKIPLSYIDQDPWRVGHCAAKQLHQMMTGGKPATSRLIPPIGVLSRYSTDSNAICDPLLRKALEFIQSHVHVGLSVTEVANVLDISRRTLESKFKEMLKSTPAAYIRKIQLQKAARLLRKTSMTTGEIAAQTGFNYTEVLMRSFKRQYGVTPMQFRGAGKG